MVSVAAVCAGYLEFFQSLGCAAGHRHLGTHDIHRRFTARILPALFCNRAQASRPRSYLPVTQWYGIAFAGHGTIQVNLAKARTDILADQDLGLSHRLIGWRCLPAVGSEMITAEYDIRSRESGSVRQAVDEVAEVGRQHAGVPTVLVHLVGCRLDQRQRPVFACPSQRRFDHQRVGGTNGIDADALTRLVPAYDFQDGFHHPAVTISSGSIANRKAASRASMIPVMVRDEGIKPRMTSAIIEVISGAPALVIGETTMALP